MFSALLGRVVREGSLVLVDSNRSRIVVGTGSASAATIRVLARAIEWKLAVQPAGAR